MSANDPVQSGTSKSNINGIGAVVVDDVLYIAGGATGEGYISKLYSFKSGATAFVELRDMFIERQNFGMAKVTMGGATGIMVAGGCCGESLNTFEFYNIGTDRWTIYETSLIQGRYGNGLVELNDRIFTFGGRTNTVEELNKVSMTWSNANFNLTSSKMNFEIAPTNFCWKKLFL